MQRLFSMFPQGLPGLGLVGLRLAVALSVLTIAENEGHQLSEWWALWPAGLAILITVGAITPLTCLMSVVTELGTHTSMAGWLETSVAVLTTIALGALGPGAYSIDAKFFGRRLVVPPNE